MELDWLEGVMSGRVDTPSGGLVSSTNPISNSGGYMSLEDMHADVPGWISKRKGLKLLSPTTTWNSVLSQSGYAPVSSWAYDDHYFLYVENGTYSAIVAYSLVTTGGWQKVVEVNYNLRISNKSRFSGVGADRVQLMNTSVGVKRLPAIYDDNYPRGTTAGVTYSSMYRSAGIPRALDPRCRNAVAGGATDHGLIALAGYEWLLLSSAVAYRICWIKRDENGILGYGMPSGRIVVRNTSTTTNYATRLKVIVPSGVADSSYVMQIYRTNIISIDGAGIIPDPGDDMYLAGEYRLTSTDLANGYVLYEDVSFDGLLGAPLYTNENQEGPLAGRQQPPVCEDIAVFNGSSFFANTTEKQRLIIKVLAVDSTGAAKGIRVGDKLVMGDLVMEGVATANEDVQSWYFAVDATAGAGSEVIRALKTTESICYKYNLWSNARNGRYAAYNMTTNNDIVGVIMLEEKSIGGSTGAYLGVDRVDAPVQILPAPVFTSTPSNTLAQAVTVATNVGPTTVTLTYAANHNLTTGDLIFLAPFGNSTESGTSSPRFVNTDVPSGVYSVTVTGALTATFTAPAGAAASQTDTAGAAAGGFAHKIFDTTNGMWTEARSDNNRRVNRLMWSPYGEPESAPIASYVDIGAAERKILRIVPTQDSLFIFKEDGLWRLKGADGDFEIVVLDSSAILRAVNTPAVLGGRVYALMTNGIYFVDDGGASKISGQLYHSIELSALPALWTNVINSWGCSHLDENAYYLTMPSVSYSSSGASRTSPIFRYHVPTKTFSLYGYAPASSNVAAIENSSPGILISYRASRSTGHDVQAYNERIYAVDGVTNAKPLVQRTSGNISDYSDFEIPAVVSSYNSSTNTVTLTATAASLGIVAGDMFMVYNGTGSYVPGGYGFLPGTTSVGLERARILSVSGFDLVLDIQGNVPLLSAFSSVPSATAVVLKRIRSSAQKVPAFHGDDTVSGRFSEVVLSVGSCGRFTKIEFEFNNEVATVTPGTEQASSEISGFAYADWRLFPITSNMTPVLQYVRTFRTGVPRQVAVGSYLIVRVSNHSAMESFDICGIKIISNAESTKTRKTNA